MLAVGSNIPPAGTLFPIHARNISEFGRQAQAVSILNRVRKAINIKTDVSELVSIDEEIQSFLLLVLEGGDGYSHVSHSVSVAIAVRYLLFHPFRLP